MGDRLGILSVVSFFGCEKKLTYFILCKRRPQTLAELAYRDRRRPHTSDSNFRLEWSPDAAAEGAGAFVW